MHENTADLNDFYYPNATLVNFVVTNFFFFMATICFASVSLTEPGKIPAVFPWDPNCPAPSKAEYYSGGFFRGIERKLDGRARFCRICGKYKPDRTHHSRNAGQCVLEMDHYCPWVQNCIGYRNKKYFFLFITYSAMGLISYCFAIGPLFALLIKPTHAGDTPSFDLTSGAEVLMIFLIFAFVVAVMLALIVTGYWFFHFWLLTKRFTTVEFCEKRNADDSKITDRGERVNVLYSRSPYDLGIYRNLKETLGPNPLLWLIPTRYGFDSSPYAGCVYEVDEKHALFKEKNNALLKLLDEKKVAVAGEEPKSEDDYANTWTNPLVRA